MHYIFIPIEDGFFMLEVFYSYESTWLHNVQPESKAQDRSIKVAA